MTFVSDALGALVVIICFAVVSFLEMSFKTPIKEPPLREVVSSSEPRSNGYTFACWACFYSSDSSHDETCEYYKNSDCTSTPPCSEDDDDNSDCSEGDDVDSYYIEYNGHA